MTGSCRMKWVWPIKCHFVVVAIFETKLSKEARTSGGRDAGELVGLCLKVGKRERLRNGRL